MKIAIAQSKSVKGEIAANIANHKTFVELAARHKANAVFFPELSLTGYEPELAKVLSLNVNDSRLEIFQEMSDSKSIAIGLGLPTITSTRPRITMCLFKPNSDRSLYSKQQLHSDEVPYFENGEGQMIFTIQNKRLLPLFVMKVYSLSIASERVFSERKCT